MTTFQCLTRKINRNIKKEHTPTSYRSFKIFNERSFTTELTYELSAFTLSQSDINDNVDAWYAIISKHLDRHASIKSRKKNPQKLTQLSSRSHPRHLVGKRTAQKDTITDITSDSQVNSNFPYRWSPASLTFNNYIYIVYIYIFIYIPLESLMEDWRKSNESSSLHKVYLLTYLYIDKRGYRFSWQIISYQTKRLVDKCKAMYLISFLAICARST